ncbi:P-loop ATPase, Sll1717 family [uncultured Dubosiella sp.]|uniref:P-loop ATPase, Sll1717 family n=1 Tax=uncultured Dubosiella sp. TaxID=1937011 RepID=UPI0027300E0D|nr:hypothetical protein [uncultured Dubosiella sp.]
MLNFYIEPEQIKLNKLSVGYTDGEYESNDDNFMNMFYKENHKLDNLRKKDTFIIAGRKGTGKTVLALYYQKEEKQKNELLYSAYTKLKDLSLLELIENSEPITDRKERYNFIIFYLYREIAQVILSEKKSYKSFKKKYGFFNGINLYCRYLKAFKKMKKTHEVRYNCDPFKLIGRSVTATNGTKAEFNTELGKAGSEYTEQVSEDYQNKKYYEVIEHYKNSIFDILKYCEIIFIIDDFDDYFNMSQDETIRMMIDFIEVLKDFNLKINQNNNENISKCIILIRDDILDIINSYDGNIEKVIFDSKITLNWNEKRGRKTLKKMICNKILNSSDEIKTFGYKTIEDIDRAFFPQKKKGKDQFWDNMTSLTFGRPRDVISLMKIMISQNPQQTKFNFEMLTNAKIEYSKHLLAELKNEMNFYRDPKEIDEIFIFFRTN